MAEYVGVFVPENQLNQYGITLKHNKSRFMRMNFKYLIYSWFLVRVINVGTSRRKTGTPINLIPSIQRRVWLGDKPVFTYQHIHHFILNIANISNTLVSPHWLCVLQIGRSKNVKLDFIYDEKINVYGVKFQIIGT